jgi:predicted nucleic acid-binding protein
MVLEAAVASQSKFIVTHNLKDFVRKGIEEHFNVCPISPKQFLKFIS